MIQWQQARPSDRLLAVLGVAVAATGFAMAVLVVVTLLNTASMAFFREDATGVSFPGLVGWGFAGLALSGRRLRRRNIGDRDGARDTVTAMVVLTPVAVLSFLPLSRLSIIASMYLASFSYPGVWLNVPL